MAKLDDSKGGGAGRRAAREARLADKLRQNLVRRKAKARAERQDAEPGRASKTAATSDKRRGASARGTAERES